MANEEWIGNGHAQIGFKMYYIEDDLLQGNVAVSYLVANMPSISLEDTPNIYRAHVYEQGGVYLMDAIAGFHYNESIKDQVGVSYLMGLGGSNVERIPGKSTFYMNNITFQGATGNVG